MKLPPPTGWIKVQRIKRHAHRTYAVVRYISPYDRKARK